MATDQNGKPTSADDAHRFDVALRYLLGELPEEGARDFESRLQSDQTAREDLSEAVLLLDATQAAFAGMKAEKAAAHAANWPLSLREITLILSLAAMLVFVASGYLLVTWGVGPRPAIATSTPQSSEALLAASWAEKLHSAPDLDPIQNDTRFLAELDSQLMDASFDSDLVAEDQFTGAELPSPPRWMLMTLAAQQQAEHTQDPSL